jgi:hypothetical protein
VVLPILQFISKLNAVLLSYRPGDIIVLRSPCIYHAVGEWFPGPHVAGQTCTPGRVSWVHFTHAEVADALNNKPSDYLTGGGSTRKSKGKALSAKKVSQRECAARKS